MGMTKVLMYTHLFQCQLPWSKPLNRFSQSIVVSFSSGEVCDSLQHVGGHMEPPISIVISYDFFHSTTKDHLLQLLKVRVQIKIRIPLHTSE